MASDERILNHVYALFYPGLLPAGFKSAEEEYCGTWILDLIHRWYPINNHYALSPTADLDEIAVMVINIDTSKLELPYVLRIETNSNVHRLSESEVFVASNHLSLSVSEGKFAIAESRKVIYMK